ncbi:MAG: diguanylate cyclase [Deltaproteobacteria bacterium]|nr:diguanylate cyclase [Deltaproteobacteria bacterium]
MTPGTVKLFIAATYDQEREQYKKWSEEEGLQADLAETAADLLGKLSKNRVDILILESRIAALGPVEFIEGLCAKIPEMYIVLILEPGQEEVAADALKTGAKDCLERPVSRHDFVKAISRILEERRIALDRKRLEQESNENRTRAAVLRRTVSILDRLDVEDVLEQFLALAMDETGSQGGSIWLADSSVPGLFNVAVFRGLVPAEDRRGFYRGERALPPGVLKGEASFGIGPGGMPDASCLLASIKDKTGLKGLLRLSGKLGKPAFTEQDRLIVQDIADAVSVGLRNARLVETLKRKMLQDFEVPAYNLNYFMDYTSKEVYKARRYGRTFSMAALKIENYHLLEESMEPGELTSLIRAVAAEIGVVIRDSDVLTRVDKETYFLLLPETDYLGSMMCLERILRRLQLRGMLAPLRGRPPISLSMGTAAFPRDGDGYKSLVVKCKLRMEEVRKSLYRKLHLEELDFWDSVKVLLTHESEDKIKEMTGVREPVWSWIFDGNAPKMSLIQDELALELSRNKDLKGIIFLGVERVSDDLAFLGRYPEMEGSKMKMFILGKRAVNQWRFPLVTPLAIPDIDADARCCDFVLFFSEAGAYACLEDKQEHGRVFHSSDTTLVARLIAKLQEYYKLQRQF